MLRASSRSNQLRLAGFGAPLGGRFLAWPVSEDEALAYRAIRTGQLHALLRFHTRPIDVVVFHGSQRDIILRLVSHLDAFSGYPFPT